MNTREVHAPLSPADHQEHPAQTVLETHFMQDASDTLAQACTSSHLSQGWRRTLRWVLLQVTSIFALKNI